MKVIGFCGRARSGKSTCAKHLEKHGYDSYNMSDVLAEHAKENNMEPTKENLSEISDRLRKEDKYKIAKLLWQNVDKDTTQVSISGFRSPEDVEFIRERVDDFILIKVEAPLEDRYERRKNENLTLEEFKKRDENDIENKGMDDVFDMADAVIRNDGSLEELYEKLDDSINQI